ncbi:MAG: tRNA pseudouridine(13) synthase TruD [Salinirussus sp.]
MREAHPIEHAVGMNWYVSDADGIGGRLRDSPSDFRVRELEALDPEPLDADPSAYPHLVCRVTLRGWDTNDFARTLSDRLGISRERVSWAGTKDKRAITTQLVSIDGVAPDVVPTIDGVDIEVIGRAGRPVLFGDLYGNAFDVRVADPRDRDVSRITDQLARFAGTEPPTVGVPNYFGQQRFGSRRPVTHEVGLAIVREDWSSAVLAYVGNPHPREPAATQEARAYVDEHRDWAGALERMPRHLRFERAMLHRLDEGRDYRDALEAVPSNLQTLFVHAAQSYIFNRILSERLEQDLPFSEPVPGDIVCFTTDTQTAVTLPDTDQPQRVTEDRLAVVQRHCDRGRAVVTAPLVGTETTLATGRPGDIEHTILDEIGVEPDDFDLPGNFASAGDRRAVLVKTAVAVEHEPLTFSFTLPRGSYATVLLREYLKTDPSDL